MVFICDGLPFDISEESAYSDPIFNISCLPLSILPLTAILPDFSRSQPVHVHPSWPLPGEFSLLCFP